jgi:general L-amino acid transport system permease protein
MTTTTPIDPERQRLLESTRRPPIYRDVRVLTWTFQLAVLAVVVAVLAWLWDNLQVNSHRQNIPTSYDYLDQPAGFPIAGSDFRPTQPVSDALVEGVLNTLRLAVTGIVLATVLGTLLGVARLSKNFLVRKGAQGYVEIVRNVPLYGLIVLLYTAVVLNAFPPPNESWKLGSIAVLNVRGSSVFWFSGGNARFLVVLLAAIIAFVVVAWWRRGVGARTGKPPLSGLYGLVAAAVVGGVVWLILGLGASSPVLEGRRVTGGITMTPPYFAALVALVLYTSSHIAEIVRGSIQAVPRGQGEAADALALSGFQRMWHVVLPQALRIGTPPIGNQYLNLTKNTSLAAAISFPELTQVTQLSVANNRSPAVPSYVLLLLIYLALSLVISAVVNLVNRRLAIVER